MTLYKTVDLLDSYVFITRKDFRCLTTALRISL